MTFDNDTRDDPDFDLEALRESIRKPTGAPAQAAALTGHALVAHRRLLVRSIRSPYPPQDDMDDTFEDMRVGAPPLRAAGMPQPAVRVLAPSFSGKSVGARDFVRRTSARPDVHPFSAVYAKLDSDGSVGSLAADILRALGEPRPESLPNDKRWARARRELKRHGVDLLILDEFQRAGRRLTVHPVIAAKILDILDDGDCAIAFVGKLDAKAIFKATGDLGNRLDPPVSIGRLRWTLHSAQFMAFADAFDEALVDAGVILVKAGLGDPKIAQLLLEASSGLIGQFSRIVETAVVNITRAGHGGITLQDLSDAVEDWAIGNDRIDYNPFDRGKPKDAKGGKKARGRKGDPADGQEGDADGDGASEDDGDDPSDDGHDADSPGTGDETDGDTDTDGDGDGDGDGDALERFLSGGEAARG